MIITITNDYDYHYFKCLNKKIDKKLDDAETFVGSCANTCISSSTVACCNANNCNKPLVCLTGTYYPSNLTQSSYSTTICPISTLYCRVSRTLLFL
jgi:hypothetical protein